MPTQPGDRWFVDETQVRLAGRWTYLAGTIDQHGQVIDILLSARRGLLAARGLHQGLERPVTAEKGSSATSGEDQPARYRVADQIGNRKN